jgi:hypothetical protein
MGIKAKIASLVVDLTANSASYNSELKKSKKETHAWSSDVKKYAKIGAAALATAAIGSAVGLARLTAEALKNGDALAKHADKLGLSTEALAGLRLQAELNGVANNALDIGLQRMVRRVSEAAKGTGVASTALAELNLNAMQLNQLSPDQQFSKIASAMDEVGSQSDRVRLGFKLFDSGGVGLINAMRGGAEAIAAARKEADQLGLTISRVDAAKMEAANDATLRADKVWSGLGNTIAISVSPFITAMKTDFYDSAKASNGFRDHVATGMKVVSKAIGFAGNAVHGMRVIWKGTQLVVATFIAETLTHLYSLSRGIVEFANLIPGINIEIDPHSGIAGFAKVAQSQVGKLKRELHDTAMMELPSDKVDKYFKRIQSEAQAAAEKVAETASKLKPSSAVDSKPDISETDVERVASELDAQNETTREAYRRRQDIIDTALASKQLSEERHLELSGNAWRKHQTELAQVEAQRSKDRLQTSKQLFGDLATLSQHGNKRLQAVGKAAAKVNIIIGTLEAAQSSYKFAAAWGGPVAGSLAAAAATAAGWMRYRAVDTAGSGSSGGGLSGSTTFDQNLPDAAVSIDNIAGAAERRSIPAPYIENYYAEGSVSAIDTQSFSTAMMNNRESVASATEAHLNEYGRSLAS